MNAMLLFVMLTLAGNQSRTDVLSKPADSPLLKGSLVAPDRPSANFTGSWADQEAWQIEQISRELGALCRERVEDRFCILVEFLGPKVFIMRGEDRFTLHLNIKGEYQSFVLNRSGIVRIPPDNGSRRSATLAEAQRLLTLIRDGARVDNPELQLHNSNEKMQFRYFAQIGIEHRALEDAAAHGRSLLEELEYNRVLSEVTEFKFGELKSVKATRSSLISRTRQLLTAMKPLLTLSPKSTRGRSALGDLKVVFTQLQSNRQP